MRIRYLGTCVAIVAIALSLTGAGAASAAAARPAAAPAKPWNGVYLVGRTVTSCHFALGCNSTPLSFLIFSPSAGSYVLSVNYGYGSKAGDFFQPALRLSWNGADWHAAGTWNVSTCGANKLVAANVTFDLTALGGSITGTFTNDQPASECGLKSDETSVETLLPAALPPWWNGSLCDNTDTSTATAAEGGPFTSTQGPPAWHGLISCKGSVTDPEYVIPPTDKATNPPAPEPLAGDEEWQCAELAQRWLYMAFGVPNVAQGLPPSGGGNSVAYKYYTQQLERYPGKYPLTYYGPGSRGPLGPGDVISYGTTAPGHVGIVMSVDPKTHTYTIIEENPANDTTTGTYTGSGDNITPSGVDGYKMNGWLHFTPK